MQSRLKETLEKNVECVSELPEHSSEVTRLFQNKTVKQVERKVVVLQQKTSRLVL